MICTKTALSLWLIRSEGVHAAHRMGDRQHPCLRPSLGVTPLPTVPFHSGMARVYSIQLLMFLSISPWTP